MDVIASVGRSERGARPGSWSRPVAACAELTDLVRLVSQASCLWRSVGADRLPWTSVQAPVLPSPKADETLRQQRKQFTASSPRMSATTPQRATADPVINRIKVCLNGGRSRAGHPAVPITPAELAAEAGRAVTAGAEAIHIHPRDADDAESLQSKDIAAAVTAVRQLCGSVPVGVSTGLWITGGDVATRLAAVAEWRSLPDEARPDFASVNVSEPGFAELADTVRQAGIGVEAGVWSPGDAKTLVGTTGWTRLLIEIIGGAAETAIDRADAILAELDDHDIPGPRLLHGEEGACWPLVAHAGRLGLPTRIGLEDVTTGPAGESITTNADLVRYALNIWHSQ
jgi:uncharacterized protein (DUF849 family)